MEKYIKEHYNIIETYEKNKYEEIQMGTKIDNPDEIIVETILKKIDSYSSLTKKDFENTLKNLLYITENDDEITFVTKYHEGVTLNDFLKNSKNKNDEKAKKDLAKQYIKAISGYDNITNNLKRILVDRKQLVIDENNKLILNELLLISSPKDVPFSDIQKSIGEVLNLLLPGNTFAKNLLLDKKDFESIEEIKIEFLTKGINNKEENTIPTEKITNKKPNESMSKEEKHTKEIELTSLEFIDNETSEQKEEDKDNKNILLPILGIVGILLIGFFMKNQFTKETSVPAKPSFSSQHSGSEYTFNADTGDMKPEEYKWTLSKDGEVITTYDKNPWEFSLKEGRYEISLKIKDENGKWSKAYSDEIVHAKNDYDNFDDDTEILDNYTIEQDSELITEDSENKHSGDKSLKIDLSEKSSASFELQDALIKEQATISLSLKSSSREPVTLTFTGYNNGIEKFEKTSTHIPSMKNTWEMINFNINSTGVENIKITLQSNNSIIWIDDIEIESYK